MRWSTRILLSTITYFPLLLLHYEIRLSSFKPDQDIGKEYSKQAHHLSSVSSLANRQNNRLSSIPFDSSEEFETTSKQEALSFPNKEFENASTFTRYGNYLSLVRYYKMLVHGVMPRPRLRKLYWELSSFAHKRVYTSDAEFLISVNHHKKLIILSFKPTTSIKNWYYNFLVISIPFFSPKSSEILGSVHYGVKAYHDSMYREYSELIKKYKELFNDYELIISGHSLGASTSIISAASLKLNLNIDSVVYSYGEPLFCDKRFDRFIKNNLTVVKIHVKDDCLSTLSLFGPFVLRQNNYAVQDKYTWIDCKRNKDTELNKACRPKITKDPFLMLKCIASIRKNHYMPPSGSKKKKIQIVPKFK